PPHYDTFGEFHYAYHYGDVYAPYIKQEEPLKTECQHSLDCIREGKAPLSSGQQGLELVRILEASSMSLKQNGSPITLVQIPRARADIGPTVNGRNGQEKQITPKNESRKKPASAARSETALSL